MKNVRQTVKSLTISCRQALRSRVAWLVVCLHALWFFLAIANMSPPSPSFGLALDQGTVSTAVLFAGRPLHFHYESFLLQSLLIADFPSGIAAIPIDMLLWPISAAFHLDNFHESYLAAFVILFTSSCQWLLIGNWVQHRFETKAWGTHFVQNLNRRFSIILILLLAIAVLSVPLVNQRSHRLRSPHPYFKIQ
jgi:hypothetical protein